MEKRSLTAIKEVVTKLANGTGSIEDLKQLGDETVDVANIDVYYCIKKTYHFLHFIKCRDPFTYNLNHDWSHTKGNIPVLWEFAQKAEAVLWIVCYDDAKQHFKLFKVKGMNDSSIEFSKVLRQQLADFKLWYQVLNSNGLKRKKYVEEYKMPLDTEVDGIVAELLGGNKHAGNTVTALLKVKGTFVILDFFHYAPDTHVGGEGNKRRLVAQWDLVQKTGSRWMLAMYQDGQKHAIITEAKSLQQAQDICNGFPTRLGFHQFSEWLKTS